MVKFFVMTALLWSHFAVASSAQACVTATSDCPLVSSLLKWREGYGRNAEGGLTGPIVTVTSGADSGPGTLRDALRSRSGAVWIRFSGDMTLNLRSQIRVPSNVTIDGRGAKVTLLDYGLSVLGSQNVIITHLTIDGRLRTFGQAIDIANGSSNVWINHLDLSRFGDRLLNVKNGSTDVTVSWVKFHDHNKVMLLNNITSDNLYKNFDRDKIARVTLHHNYFVNTVQRNPRAQFGVFHLYNNLLENWDFYGMSFGLEARVLIEGNMFRNTSGRKCVEPEAFPTVEGIEANYCRYISIASKRASLENGEADHERYEKTKEKYKYSLSHMAFLRVRENQFLGDATPTLKDHRPDEVPLPPYCYSYEKPTQSLETRIRQFAGNTDFEKGGGECRN